MLIVMVAARASKHSVQKLNLKTFSSTKEQDFWEDAISHGRKFLLSVLLYRKIRRMSSARQEFLDQDNSAGTRV